MNQKEFDNLVNHLKGQGFIFPGSDIYGGLSNSWDYGPLGVELKRKLKEYWWKIFINKNKFNVGLDSSILLNQKVWEASGHITNFSDPLIDCKIEKCKVRFRADDLIEKFDSKINTTNWSNEQLQNYLDTNDVVCLKCGQKNFTKVRQFQLMFKTYQGVVEEEKSLIYLRPETAQGIFINFNQIQRSLRLKLPFGVGQIGKSFRNEVTPGNFIFRTREFEQMELEFFYHPQDDHNWFDYWVEFIKDFLINKLKINEKKLVFNAQDSTKLAHYAKKTTDIEYKFPFGQKELWGISERGDYDFQQHNKRSNTKLQYLDEKNNQIVPYVIEPSVGLERLILAILCESYSVEQLDNQTNRTLLKLPNFLTPYYIAILPITKKENEQAQKIYDELFNLFDITIDLSSQSIGKKYYRQDAIGTRYCITIDSKTEKKQKVTIRDRDTRTQISIKLKKLSTYLQDQF